MPVSSTKQACHWGLLIQQMHLGLSKNVLTQLWSHQFEEQNVTQKLVNIVYMCTVYSILLHVCCDILHILFIYVLCHTMYNIFLSIPGKPVYSSKVIYEDFTKHGLSSLEKIEIPGVSWSWLCCKNTCWIWYNFICCFEKFRLEAALNWYNTSY